MPIAIGPAGITLLLTMLLEATLSRARAAADDGVRDATAGGGGVAGDGAVVQRETVGVGSRR